MSEICGREVIGRSLNLLFGYEMRVIINNVSAKIYYNIFYVVMKQSTSASYANSKLNKKSLLPTFRQSKMSSKVQQVCSSNKSQIYINNKLLPLQIVAERKPADIVKIVVNVGDIILQDCGKSYKTFINSSANDQNTKTQWLLIVFGEVFSTIKVKKIGDENTFAACSSMISWQKDQSLQKKLAFVINLKDIIKGQQKSLQNFTINTVIQKQDQTKQMKAFVANLMSKKLNRRTTQKLEGEPRFNIRKKSQVLKNRPNSNSQQLSQYAANRLNLPSTSETELSAISGPRSLRRDFFDKNLKQSKFTGKSQKQTSIGDQSLFINNKLNSKNMVHMSTLQNDDYQKKKQKFDSQPYFYQKSTITSQFSNHNDSTQKHITLSRQECASKQNLADSKADQIVQNIGSCLLNKSEHKSEEQVQEDIKRSAMLQSSIKNQDQDFKSSIKKKQKKQCQSSQCVESKELQSSGTIYQSKYQ